MTLAAVMLAGKTAVVTGASRGIGRAIAAALAGAGAGGAAGGLVGALIGWGIPEERIAEYESGIREGGILMGVRPRTDDDALAFESSWRDANASLVRS